MHLGSIFGHCVRRLSVAALVLGGAAARSGDTRLTPVTLDRAIALGRKHLLTNQLSAGNFHYEFRCDDLKARGGESVTRQAGALWGLAIAQRHRAERDLERALRRGLGFFRGHSREDIDGRRFFLYPDQPNSTGAVALVCLALIDYLRSQHTLTDGEKEQYLADLDSYLSFLLSLRTAAGQFHSSYTDAGAPAAAPSPYFDGEALLCLVRAAKYLKYADLRPKILASAEQMHKANVVIPLTRDPDSTVTKGFYQWGTMAYYELYTSGWEGTQTYARRAILLGYWILDAHQVLDKPRNTAYAFEGLTHACELARLTDDQKAMAKFAAAVDEGLGRLLTWQAANPAQNDYLRELPQLPERAVGGVLNHASEPWLRIDVAQHQLHAVILARTLLYQNAAATAKDDDWSGQRESNSQP